MTLAQTIKHYRLQANLSQAQLAAMIGANKISVHRWETNTTGCQFKYAARIAIALGFSLDALLEPQLPTGEQLARGVR